jgi:PIN domain nuclease of toxin-antitoxin system
VSRFLVDTHAVLWWLAGDRRLPPRARDAIADPANDALVSAASAWEIAIKRSTGKLEAPDLLLDEVRSVGLQWLPVTAEHAWAVRRLPHHHRDPFDRLLVAQATLEDAVIVSGDRRLAAYGVAVRWD